MNSLTLKQELIRRREAGERDIPNRNQSGTFGTKNVAALSLAIKRIKQAKTRQESDIAGKYVRTLDDQNVALRMNTVFALRSMLANREVCFKYDWHEVFQPEDGNVGQFCILEFLVRIFRNTYRAAKLPLDLSAQDFVVVPEIWSSTKGHSVPLHFHMLINVPDQGLDWFDARYQTVWEQILRANNVKGDIYSDSIGDKEKLAGYSLKQLDIEWVFDRTLWPIDLLKYTGTSS